LKYKTIAFLVVLVLSLIAIEVALILGFPSKYYYLIPGIFGFNILCFWGLMKFLILPSVLFLYAKKPVIHFVLKEVNDVYSKRMVKKMTIVKDFFREYIASSKYTPVISNEIYNDFANNFKDLYETISVFEKANRQVI
jgi:hypothetical protein